jgi:hypothetical protein
MSQFKVGDRVQIKASNPCQYLITTAGSIGIIRKLTGSNHVYITWEKLSGFATLPAHLNANSFTINIKALDLIQAADNWDTVDVKKQLIINKIRYLQTKFETRHEPKPTAPYYEEDEDWEDDDDEYYDEDDEIEEDF